MSKKTFISNQELELTQKIQLQFPRGVIPTEVLTYWENCHPDILQIVLKDAFYFLENVNDPKIRVRRPIPFKLPHNENLDGSFYFKDNTDLLERGYIFDVRDVNTIEVKDMFGHLSNPHNLLAFIEREKIIERQLDMFQLWAIYLRGYDFFLQYFQGVIYALRSAFVINDDIYFPCVSVDVSKNRSLRIGWYSSWNTFVRNDFVLQF
ncbi:MAG: hypothetical protein WCT42_01140 [Candidatus Paceibacterota bacterium]